MLTLKGLDLDKLSSKKRFAFIDGLSGLFISNLDAAGQQRGRRATMSRLGKAGEKVLTDSRLESISKEISSSIESLDGGQGDGLGKVVLVIDQLDLLLAAGGEDVTPTGVGEMLLGLREVRLLSFLVKASFVLTYASSKYTLRSSLSQQTTRSSLSFKHH